MTALAPYLILGVLFVQGILLPGAGTGIKYYLMPNVTKLAEAKVNLLFGVPIKFNHRH